MSAYPNAGKRTVHDPILRSRKNGGPGVQALLTEAPSLGPPQRPSGLCGERTSKGTDEVFAVRRKRSEVDFARTRG